MHEYHPRYASGIVEPFALLLGDSSCREAVTLKQRVGGSSAAFGASTFADASSHTQAQRH
jgi:hypothetical protein